MPDTSRRPFRFGVQASAPATGREWVDLARRVESLGYAVMTMPDHFDGQLAPVPALQCAADATSSLRIGTLVFDNDYRHPVVLAKELATIDVLSEGRLEIGLGAGWMLTDYQQSGIPYDRAGVRVDRFIEGLAVIRGCLGGEPFSFEGRHYRITDHVGRPEPVQSPPPVLIGGGGPRVLRFAATEADIVGINATLASGELDQSTFDSMTAGAVDDKVAIVRAAADAAGRSDMIELQVRTFLVMVSDDVAGSLDALASLSGLSPELIAASPFALVGPPSKIAEDLLERRERWGFSYVTVGQQDVEPFAPVVSALAGT